MTQGDVSFRHGHGDWSPDIDATALYNAVAAPITGDPGLSCPRFIEARCECAEWWDCPIDRRMMAAEGVTVPEGAVPLIPDDEEDS